MADPCSGPSWGQRPEKNQGGYLDHPLNDLYGGSFFPYRGQWPETRKWGFVTGRYKGSEVTGNAVTNGNPAVNDVKWSSKSGDMYMVGSTGLRYDKGHTGGTIPSAVIRVDKEGTYHPMGLMLLPQMVSKPIKGIYCIYLDETRNPVYIYIGGTFGFRWADSNHKNYLFNVAKWDYKLNDWGPVGKGVFRQLGMNEQRIFPRGYPGIPAKPIEGYTTFLRELFPRVRCLTMDKTGNLYAGGAIGILDDNPDVTKRVEHYGILKYDKKSDTWGPATNCGGVSRDVFDMSWLDERRLLLTGGFLYGEDYRLLNNVAVLDTVSGELSPLGGGLYKGHNAHVYSANVRHTVNSDGYWFGGWFKYAGVDQNEKSQATIESNYIAHYNPDRNLDPNHGLRIVQPEPVKGPKGNSSESRKIRLQATGISPDKGQVIWYTRQRKTFKKAGQGLSSTVSLRVKKGMRQAIFYASVKTVLKEAKSLSL